MNIKIMEGGNYQETISFLNDYNFQFANTA